VADIYQVTKVGVGTSMTGKVLQVTQVYQAVGRIYHLLCRTPVSNIFSHPRHLEPFTANCSSNGVSAPPNPQQHVNVALFEITGQRGTSVSDHNSLYCGMSLRG
jgi:hypothetical protein